MICSKKWKIFSYNALKTENFFIILNLTTDFFCPNISLLHKYTLLLTLNTSHLNFYITLVTDFIRLWSRHK